MRKLKYWICGLSVIIMVVMIGCEDTNQNTNPDFEYLKGTWIDKESFALQFIDFYSDNQGRFGRYSKNFERYDTFHYRIINSNQIAIHWLGDIESIENLHDLIKIGNDTIRISHLSDVPENPDKIYVRRRIITGRQDDTIRLGYNQEYFDFNYDIRLRLDSVMTDSRCPRGAICLWEGNAEVRLELITEGNYQHYLFLNTNQKFKVDTLVGNIKLILVGLEPYPAVNQAIDSKDYIITVIVKKVKPASQYTKSAQVLAMGI